MVRGVVRAVVALGGNLIAAAPDTERTARAFEGTALTVSIATKLNRSHLHPGAHGLVLPCLGRTEKDVQASGEQFVTVEDSMSMVHRSRGVLAPASPELRSEVAIVCALGKALAPRAAVAWDELAADYDRIRDAIARVMPALFADSTVGACASRRGSSCRTPGAIAASGRSAGARSSSSRIRRTSRCRRGGYG